MNTITPTQDYDLLTCKPVSYFEDEEDDIFDEDDDNLEDDLELFEDDEKEPNELVDIDELDLDIADEEALDEDWEAEEEEDDADLY